jgi:hypothetical protein
MGTTTITTNNIKTRTPVIVPPMSTTPRVSDLDVLMAAKHIDNTKTPPKNQVKSTVISPSPLANNFQRSLFSTNTVKIVRPVRSQELKIFSCHLTPEISSPKPPLPSPISDETSNQSNIDETLSTLTQTSSEQKPDNQIDEKSDDSSSNTSDIRHDLSDDSLNSLNEHYHIRQLLKSSKWMITLINKTFNSFL